MVTRYGMSELGHVALDDEHANPFGMPTGYAPPSEKSDATAREIDIAVRGLVDHAFTRARGLLETHRPILLDGAAQLLERETLTETELAPLFERLKGGSSATTAA